MELSGTGSTLDKDANLRDSIEDSGDPQIAITRKGQSRGGVPIRGSLVNCGDLTLAARSLVDCEAPTKVRRAHKVLG